MAETGEAWRKVSDVVVGRFAPTPSGRIHLGNIFCSLLAWLSARATGGRIILRIEDLDPNRTSKELALQLEQDLSFLGLDWDEGGSRGGEHAPYFQQERTAYYQEVYDRLNSMGLLYPCFCSRTALHAAEAPHTSDGEPIYSGHCRHLSPAQVEEAMRRRTPSIRLSVPDKVISFTDRHYGLIAQRLSTECGDFIVRRADGVFAYQLAVVTDDAAMGVNEVVRGRDLLASTPRQLYLYELLGWKPPRFCHVPLLLAPDGRRLSKRDADLDLGALRGRGLTAAEIVGRLAFLSGLLERPEPVMPRDLLPTFRWEKVAQEDIRLPAELFE